MSGTYGKVKTPGSKFTVAVFCFPTLSHSLKEAVMRDFPEPAVPITKTMNIQTPLLRVKVARTPGFPIITFQRLACASSQPMRLRRVSQNRFFDAVAG